MQRGDYQYSGAVVCCSSSKQRAGLKRTCDCSFGERLFQATSVAGVVRNVSSPPPSPTVVLVVVVVLPVAHHTQVRRLAPSPDLSSRPVPFPPDVAIAIHPSVPPLAPIPRPSAGAPHLETDRLLRLLLGSLLAAIHR
ncbi:hypothetical protein B0H10DRAFT_2041912 [Mycena sp. CBHHK59/15]|nr:hypothetical protein B0H10DRAFT_2041912 [Mycena sp. CBHHK59/15]